MRGALPGSGAARLAIRRNPGRRGYAMPRRGQEAPLRSNDYERFAYRESPQVPHQTTGHSRDGRGSHGAYLTTPGQSVIAPPRISERFSARRSGSSCIIGNAVAHAETQTSPRREWYGGRRSIRCGCGWGFSSRYRVTRPWRILGRRMGRRRRCRGGRARP